MMFMTLALAWYFYDSARWFSNDTQRLAVASSILASYQDVARLTYRELHLLESSVRESSTAGREAVQSGSDQVSALFVSIREALNDERLLSSDNTEPLVLDELQTTTEDIFQSSLLIQAAVERDQIELANQELTSLRSQGTVSRFESLVGQSIEERQGVLDRYSLQAVSLADYILRLMPLIMALFFFATAWVAWRFAHSLSRSLGVLHDAAREFATGNLGHKVPDVPEREFRDLGKAFNRMASQLAEKSTQLRDSNVSLEAKVEERTRALKQSNQKLAQVDEHRRKLLADISHEFRTPLTVIKGESEIALRGRDASKKDYRDSFRRIIETADHATSLVEDLLFIVRADAGQQTLQKRNLEVLGLLRDVCEEFRGKATKKEIKIHYRVGVERATLDGDARRLRQVFAILLDNALRYSSEGDDIEVTSSSESGKLVIQVLDQGIGLNAEEAEQAFNRFFRGQKAMAHAEHGSGLGLPVAKAIVEAHGGNISLQGREERGAVASVMLPVEGSLRVVA